MIVEEDTIDNRFIDKYESISVKDIYKKIKEKKYVMLYIILQNKNCSIKLKQITDDFYSFEINYKEKNTIENVDLLTNPLKLYIKEKAGRKIIDIVNPTHLEKMQKKFIDYNFFCEASGKNLKFSDLI